MNGNKMKTLCVGKAELALILTLILSQLHVAFAADSAKGESIAARWCNSCHLATSGQRTGSDAAPTFAQIANDPRLTPDVLRLALSGRHPRMPDISLDREQFNDLSAYLRSLRK